MKRNKQGFVAFLISLLPLLTLVISELDIKITSNIQMGLSIWNMITTMTAFILSVCTVKNCKKRDAFSILALCISGFFLLLIVGIIAFGLLATFGSIGKIG